MEKQASKRAKGIEEIIETEGKFINDLRTTLDAFDKTSIPMKVNNKRVKNFQTIPV